MGWVVEKEEKFKVILYVTEAVLKYSKGQKEVHSR